MAGRNLKPQGRCIFCGGLGLTKEHIWPDWLSGHLQSESPYHLYGTGIKTSDKKHTEQISRRTGSILSRKLRIVCGYCNNGWMSRLQNKAKPILLPLITGASQNFSLASADAKVIAAWATMFTMVVEFADPKTIAVSEEERKEFSISQEPKRNWNIWFGLGPKESKDKPWDFMHYGWSVEAFPDNEEMTARYRAQSTTFLVGTIFFLTYSSDTTMLDFDPNKLADAAGIRPIWPNASPIFNFPIRTFDGYDLHDLSRIFIMKMDPNYPQPTGWVGRVKS